MASGRDPLSVHRSLQRYLSTILPPPWDVQPTRKERQQRPLAVVRPVGPAPATGSAYVREYEQPYEVFAYPIGVESQPWHGESEARWVLNTILRAFDAGHGTGRDRGYSLRVPLFDYSDVLISATIPVDRQPLDYLALRLPRGEVRQDPDADDLFTVNVDFRVNWRDDGDLRRYEGAVLEEVVIPDPTEPPPDVPHPVSPLLDHVRIDHRVP
jgi:hypothetical protein